MPPKRSREPKYEEMSRKELQTLAKEKGISGRLASTEIIRLLRGPPKDDELLLLLLAGNRERPSTSC